ncbi:uncharacterized protein LOC124271730 [Haliotis rubra]|uniref:uncharacterized protein LOC124271730 n=1 Tax=Haliotis rubra TaxID=36100 RepID=UPI001EE5A71B|nr:uncharacterized protein LOC124271730 [Haliotis rubra]
METLTSIRTSLNQGDWAISIDLKDAYLHIPIHKTSKKYLRFVFEDRMYEFHALPFGLASAPYVFTRVMKAVVARLHCLGLRFHAYLDDSLSPARSNLLCASQREATVSPADHRLNAFVTLAHKLCKKTFATPREIHFLLGQIESFSKILPWAKLAKRELQLMLASKWDHLSWDTPVPLGTWFNSSISQRLARDFLSPTMSLHQPTPTHRRAGGHIWAPYRPTFSGNRTFRNLHINVLEMEVVNRAVEVFKPHLANKVTLLRTDNTTVAASINKEGGTQSPELCQRTLIVPNKMRDLKGHLIAQHIQGKINVLADALSRRGMVVQTEWTLHHSVVKGKLSAWETPHVVLLATRLNHRLPLFVSPVPNPLAWARMLSH